VARVGGAGPVATGGAGGDGIGRTRGWLGFLALVVALRAANLGARASRGWLPDGTSTHANLGPWGMNRLADYLEGAIAGSGQHTTRSNTGVAAVGRMQVVEDRITVAAIAGRFILVSQASGSPTPSSAGGQGGAHALPPRRIPVWPCRCGGAS